MRPFIEFLKTQGKQGLIGAEIGVYKGENAKTMLNLLDIKKLYLVDSYPIYFEDGFFKNVPWDKRTCDAKNIAKNNLSLFDNKEFIYKTSKNASKEFPDDFFDFIYIDAKHDKKSVYRDICLWYSKLKLGGIIGGHDFDKLHQGVINAVEQFAKENDLVVNSGNNEGDFDWWVIK